MTSLTSILDYIEGVGLPFNSAASKFRLGNPSGYNIPKPKFLYYVNFVSRFLDGLSSISFYVKRTDRLSMTYDMQDINQYNRRRVIQTRAQYQPMTMSFYDTVDSAAVKMLQAYNAFYNQDFVNKNNNSWHDDIVGANFEATGSWGLQATASASASHFFERIEIYEFFDQVYTQYNFMNPKISQFGLEGLDVEVGNQGGVVNMTMKFEGVQFAAVSQPITPELSAMWGIPYDGDANNIAFNVTLPGGIDISGGANLANMSLALNATVAGGVATSLNNVVNNVLAGNGGQYLTSASSFLGINGAAGMPVGGSLPPLVSMNSLATTAAAVPSVNATVLSGQSCTSTSTATFDVAPASTTDF